MRPMHAFIAGLIFSGIVFAADSKYQQQSNETALEIYLCSDVLPTEVIEVVRNKIRLLDKIKSLEETTYYCLVEDHLCVTFDDIADNLKSKLSVKVGKIQKSRKMFGFLIVPFPEPLYAQKAVELGHLTISRRDPTDSKLKMDIKLKLIPGFIDQIEQDFVDN